MNTAEQKYITIEGERYRVIEFQTRACKGKTKTYQRKAVIVHFDGGCYGGKRTAFFRVRSGVWEWSSPSTNACQNYCNEKREREREQRRNAKFEKQRKIAAEMAQKIARIRDRGLRCAVGSLAFYDLTRRLEEGKRITEGNQWREWIMSPYDWSQVGKERVEKELRRLGINIELSEEETA